MQIPVVIDTAWHPLTSGCPPEWASAWGQDEYGVFAAFTVGAVTQRLRWIPPGRFLMGSAEDETAGLAKADHERKWLEAEHPQHEVYITEGFWLFDTPCTQALWETVMPSNPSRFKSPNRPVEQISWDDTQIFLQRINDLVPGLNLVLPNEAQWEHACRAGTHTALYSGAIEILGDCNAPALDPIAWYAGNSGVEYDLSEGEDSSAWPEMQYPNPLSGTREVGRKQPNPWGVYDMLGNVWEWCADGLRDYGPGTQLNPVGSLEPGGPRVVRGGSWSDSAGSCRCAYRFHIDPDSRSDDLGFRCARVQG
ncbi:MAG: Sulphatase-modifying factor protein [Methylobacter sp.]|nr:MAG: Sulphatase-modifying factor protein [Methylobacter sp.]PPD17988.1 MAG: Sulphatase-modifying factor protein [Methylobacter sp.]PPD33952.1 MAG: Sulphatase-modifying factor protein [Methylomonas sp.]